jgi:hypothetical protein
MLETEAERYGRRRFLETLEAGSEWEARKTLLRSSVPAPLTHLS